MEELRLIKWIQELIELDELWRFYKSKEWIGLKNMLLEYNHYECERCRAKGRISSKDRRLEVHHNYRVREYPQYALSEWITIVSESGETERVKNLEVLCHKCHWEEHEEEKKEQLEKNRRKSKKEKEREHIEERW